MKVETLDELSAVIDLARAKGVTVLEVDGVRFSLGAVPVAPGEAPRTTEQRQEQQPPKSVDDLLFMHRRFPGKTSQAVLSRGARGKAR